MSKIEFAVMSFFLGVLVVACMWRLWRSYKQTVMELHGPDLDETIERLSAEMQEQIEARIGDMSTQDIVRAMMGRELARTVDEELMTGVEATTETIPPGTIPYTTSHTVDRSPERLLSASIELMATELVANEAIPWSEAMRRAEENHTIEGTGPLPFIDPATGAFTDRDPGLEPVRGQAPLLEWMLDSCRQCSQFVMMNTTIDDQEQAELCGEGANEPCNVFAMWLAEPEVETIHPEPSEPPPDLYVWMYGGCTACEQYDMTVPLVNHAVRCYQCRYYGAWYERGGNRQIPGGHELVEPPPVDEDLGGMEVPPQVAEQIMDLAPSDVQTDARVPARCPWMIPYNCDGCRSVVPRLCPVDQAVRCAGEAEPPGQGHRCNIFHTWSLTCSPGHPYLAKLKPARECNQIRVIRFKR